CTFHDAAVFDRPDAYTAAFSAWYRYAFRRLARSALLVLTVSAFSKERLAEALPAARGRLAVVANGAEHLVRLAADLSVLGRLGLERQGYLLAVGSANPTKNFAALAQAFSALAARGALRLVFVGAARRTVFAAAGPRGAADPRIVYAGAVTDAELKALYANALALVFPSTYEGFGLPPLEAMSCGCPVAASNAAAVPEVCGDAALYFDPRSPAAIGAAVQRMVDEPALRDLLRERGRLRVAAFTWDKAAGALLAALSERGLIAAPATASVHCR
ncbi:MAG: glycosyltransferase family 4 protein, partial [Methylibium sp.]|nr:glycosyltransferase family 4 protein [Methylibium sp.]